MTRIDKRLERITGTDEKHLGLDEMVACGVDFHMERMSDSYVWFVLYDDVKRTAQNVELHATRDGKLVAHVRPVEHE